MSRYTVTEFDDVNTYIIIPIIERGFIFKKEELDIVDLETILDGMDSYNKTGNIGFVVDEVVRVLKSGILQRNGLLTYRNLTQIVRDGIEKINAKKAQRKRRSNELKERKRIRNRKNVVNALNNTTPLPTGVTDKIANFLHGAIKKGGKKTLRKKHSKKYTRKA